MAPPCLTDSCSSEYAVLCGEQEAGEQEATADALQAHGHAVRRAPGGLAWSLPRRLGAVPSAARRGWTLVDRPAHPPRSGTRTGAVAEHWRVGAGDQRWAVCAAQPERAGALSETRRQ